MNDMNPRKVNTVASLVISASICLVVIFFSGLQGWPLIITIFLVIVGGQAFRYFLNNSRFFKVRTRKEHITRKQMEMEVRTFFNANPDIARRFLRMDELARAGRVKDAIAIGAALKRERLSNIVRKYVDYKLDSYRRL